MSDDRRKIIIKRLGTADILIIDEISYCSAAKFAEINRILKDVRRSKLDWGGMHLIVSGDFYQFRSMGVTLDKAIMNLGEYAKDSTKWVMEKEGAELFSSMRKFEFKENERCDDVRHQKFIQRCRDRRFPFHKKFQRRLKKMCLKKEDLENNPKFKYALIMVRENKTRRHINLIQLKRWATEHGKVILTWYNKIGTKRSKHGSHAEAVNMVDTYPELQYFAKDAQCTLGSPNIDP